MSNLSVFSFNSKQVRTATDSRDRSVWFVLKDVLEAMGSATTTSNAKASIHEVFGGGCSNDYPIIDSLGRTQTATIINEPAVTFLVSRSNTETGKKLNRWIHAEVIPSIRQTGGYSQVPRNRTQADEKIDLLYMAERLADTLNLSGSGRIAAIGKLVDRHIPELSVMLPHYAVDAPVTSTTGSSEPTFSATHLLKQHGSSLSALRFNLLCEKAGVLERKTRKKKSGGVGRFWSVTETGLRYGKNITSPACQNETQPHWFESEFSELLTLLAGDNGKKAA